MEAIFSDIYARNKWLRGSGPGSTQEYCAPLVAYLRDYIAANNIGLLCDLGCGDLQWMPELIHQANILYTGVDCVPGLIEKHREDYPSGRFQFLHADVSAMEISAIPYAHLYFMKDALQHWESEHVERFLRAFFRARPDAHFLTANCSFQTSDDRVLDGGARFAPLSGDFRPLNQFRPQRLFDWQSKTLYRLQG